MRAFPVAVIFPSPIKIEHHFAIRCRYGRIFLYRIIDLASLSSYTRPAPGDPPSGPQGGAGAKLMLKDNVIFFGFRFHFNLPPTLSVRSPSKTPAPPLPPIPSPPTPP